MQTLTTNTPRLAALGIRWSSRLATLGVRWSSRLATLGVRWSSRLATLGILAALTASPAFAEGEDGGGSAKEKIRKQMEKIRTLMEENETALLDLSAGKKAKTKRVDVDVPQPDGKSGGEGSEGSNGSNESGGASGSEGESAEKAMDELLRKQAESADSIPGEIERLVKMIPL